MSENTELTRYQPSDVVQAEDFMPLMNMQLAVQRKQQMTEFLGKILHEGADYGVIPGTNDSKVLKKPGAEKLCSFFGLTPTVNYDDMIEDWTGADHGGEPLFYYRIKVQLWRGSRLLAEGIGSCNSREKKYRYRNGERKCPECGKSTIIKGKAEYGGGFLCFGKKGGCGAKFKDTDQAITGQEVGQVINPDIYDVINTCQKMAHKRALVAAVLIGTNVSDSFTQDLDEDLEEHSRNDPKPDPKPDPKADVKPQPGREQMPAGFDDPDPRPLEERGEQKPKPLTESEAAAKAAVVVDDTDLPESVRDVLSKIGAAGGVRLACDFVKKMCLEVFPEVGGTLYSRMLIEYGIKPTGANSGAKVRAFVIAAYRKAAAAVKEAAEAAEHQQEAVNA